MPPRHKVPTAPGWEALAIVRIAALALVEAVWGIFTWPFRSRRENVQLIFVPTPENEHLIDGCPAIRTFSCCPWALGAHAQTLFGIIKVGGRPVPRKELVTMVDGVQITLLWFEPSDAPPDAPVVVSLHGVGGDENSVRPIVLAEECLKRGWRSVLYVRRGHGDSSLLPVGAVGGTSTGTGTAAVTPRIKAAELELQPSPGGPTPAAATPSLSPPSPPSPPPPPPSSSPPQGTARSSSQSHGLAGPGKGSPAGKTPGGEPQAYTSVDAVASIIATATPATPVPAPGAVAAAAATPATSVAATTGAADLDADDDADAASLASADSRTNCLPRNLHLNLPLPCGLGGAADSPAAAAAAAAAAADPEALRRTRKAFPQHADTEDFEAVLLHIRAARPLAPMVAVGFSMGSNVLVKFLGEQPPGRPGLGASNPLAAGISVCNGYDIVEGTRHLVSSRPLADRIITSALHKLLRRKLPEVHAICAAHGVLVDFDEVLACNTVREFERALMLPICGLQDVDEYYQHNNCREALRDVSTPLLCLSARDDPIIDPSLLRHAEAAATSNPHVLLAVTRRGGHLGWMQGWRGRSWMIDVILQYVNAVVQLEREQLAAAAAAAPTAVVADGVGGASVVRGGGGGGGGGLDGKVQGAVPMTVTAGVGAGAGAGAMAGGGAVSGAGELVGSVVATEVVIDVRS